MVDFVRISCAVPNVFVANTEKNCDEIIKKIKDAIKEKANFVLFPELSVTGYTCGDLFFQDRLLSGTKSAVLKILNETKDTDMVVIVGAPIALSGAVYNCALVLSKGRVVGIVPKTHIPNYDEFYEKRHFQSAKSLKKNKVLSTEIFNTKDKYEICIGNNLIFKTENEVSFGVEICEDLWSPIPPSTNCSLNGADIIFNLSASSSGVGKREFRQDLVKMQSAKTNSVYAFVSSGKTESTTDLVFSGHSIVCENGKITAENKKTVDNNYLLVTDVDLSKIRADKIRYKDKADALTELLNCTCETIFVPVSFECDGKNLKIPKNPFVPECECERVKRTAEIFEMQKCALAKRLSITGKKAVIGISGGLDSTLALLVTVSAMKEMGEPLSNILAVSMPCFGTTDRTKNNATALMEGLGVSIKNISIKNVCTQHFEDIGHDINVCDVTYENSQARERTQVLMDLSNEFGGIVVGTGDLSELALGWCTYCGDQMSMYGVNAGIPKTLMREMILNLAKTDEFKLVSKILNDIVETPISPELLPPDKNGEIKQKTEDSVGPYELCDFYLFYVLRYGFSPAKIFEIAKIAFCDTYTDDELLKWLKQFFKRFFTQQFKRSCMPDGIKIGNVNLSPRGGFKMPSDAESAIWIEEIEKYL